MDLDLSMSTATFGTWLTVRSSPFLLRPIPDFDFSSQEIPRTNLLVRDGESLVPSSDGTTTLPVSFLPLSPLHHDKKLIFDFDRRNDPLILLLLARRHRRSRLHEVVRRSIQLLRS